MPRCREKTDPKLNYIQCRFRRGRSTTEQLFTLQQIFKQSWEHAKDVYTCFADLEEVHGRVLREKLWGCCGSTVLTGASCWQSSILAQNIVSVSTELNHNRSDNSVFCHHSSSYSTVHQGSPNDGPWAKSCLRSHFHLAAKHILPVKKK